MNAPADKIGSSPAVTVRRMSAADVPAALSILKESPEASMWSSESLWESASRGMAWAAELDGSVAGILIGRVAADEFEILNLAVGKAWKRRGVGTKLVRVAVESARIAGARQTYLEVRVSNGVGIAFYERFGFRICGRRPNYYRHPTEDAVLLALHNQEPSP